MRPRWTQEVRASQARDGVKIKIKKKKVRHITMSKKRAESMCVQAKPRKVTTGQQPHDFLQITVSTTKVFSK